MAHAILKSLLDKWHFHKSRLERFWLRNQVGCVGSNSVIYQGVVLFGNPENITLGDRVAIYHRCMLTVGRDGRISVGDDSHLGVNTYLNASEGKIIIGKHVAIAPMTQIYSYSNIYKKNMYIDDCHNVEDVVIEDNVLVGSAVTILPGVTIHEGAVVGAGAVINRDVPPYCIVAGVPARKIGNRTK